ncbi:biopolymer transporter ExbD [Synechococcales cyanobacterium C]|uniref:Biopolymer transporter ExbD n=1 Tax=Petrachloros mirabilis ULC683 TaxID=2781853 RepID=A0A8K2A8Z6_9CYAN|nr:biopolymer transporter ExbD [Petrachloros mirabilis]NCJ08569.1 biopolymer transporter ExbD [Petrachloros mirabilis ULC683]
MKISVDADTSEVQIQIIPLIDVIFCILTFFILAAVGLTRQQGINLDLPQAETGRPQLGDTLRVRVDAIGQLYVEQQAVTEPQLTQSLQTYVRARPTGVIVLNADRLVSYDQVVRVLDILQSVGGNRVALGTTTPETRTTPAPETSPPTPGFDPFSPFNGGVQVPEQNNDLFMPTVPPTGVPEPDNNQNQPE